MLGPAGKLAGQVPAETRARRIGHGTALPLETDAAGVAREMAAKGVLIEANLVSNSVILEVPPEDHPYAWFRKLGVPVALSTDDSGISRHELWGDYAFAVRNGATYGDLKTAARNGIAFSFLAGEGLWTDPNVYRKPVAACAGQIGNAEPRGACADFVARSDKAREQWRHERLLKAFESR